ncbi:GPP34 family phosphoprotein [Acidobacteriota bacterium]
MKKNELLLHEAIMLLALKDIEGTLFSGVNYSYAIGGAVLAELMLNKRLSVEESRKKSYAIVQDPTPMGDPLLDECLNKVVQAKKRQQLATWVSGFSRVKKTKHRVAKKLIEKGILREEEDKVMLIFTRKIYPEFNPEPEKILMQRLEQAIFTDKPDIDTRTVVLLSLVKNAEILNFLFDKKQIKNRKHRIEQVINGELTGQATQAAIQAMRAAVLVTCIMPAILVSTTAGH